MVHICPFSVFAAAFHKFYCCSLLVNFGFDFLVAYADFHAERICFSIDGYCSLFAFVFLRRLKIPFFLESFIFR